MHDLDLGAKIHKMGQADKLISFYEFNITEIIFFKDGLISITIQVPIDNKIYIGSFDYNWGTFKEFLKQIPPLYTNIEKFKEFFSLAPKQGTVQIPFEEPIYEETAVISGKVKELTFYDDGRPFIAFQCLLAPPENTKSVSNGSKKLNPKIQELFDQIRSKGQKKMKLKSLLKLFNYAKRSVENAEYITNAFLENKIEIIPSIKKEGGNWLITIEDSVVLKSKIK